MTIGVNTAHCEGSFSTLKRIKSYLRSTMCEQRLTDLAILSIERFKVHSHLSKLLITLLELIRTEDLCWCNMGIM